MGMIMYVLLQGTVQKAFFSILLPSKMILKYKAPSSQKQDSLTSLDVWTDIHSNSINDEWKKTV